MPNPAFNQLPINNALVRGKWLRVKCEHGHLFSVQVTDTMIAQYASGPENLTARCPQCVNEVKVSLVPGQISRPATGNNNQFLPEQFRRNVS